MGTKELIAAVRHIEQELRQLSEDLDAARQPRYAVRSEDLADQLARALRKVVTNSPEYQELGKTQPNEVLAEAARRARAKSGQ